MHKSCFLYLILNPAFKDLSQWSWLINFTIVSLYKNREETNYYSLKIKQKFQ